MLDKTACSVCEGVYAGMRTAVPRTAANAGGETALSAKRALAGQQCV